MKYIILSIAIWSVQLFCYSQGTVSINISPNDPTINDDLYLMTNVFFTSSGNFISQNTSWQGSHMNIDLYYKKGGQQMPSTIKDSVQMGLLNEGTYSVIARLMVKNQPGADTDLQNYEYRDSDTITFRVEKNLGIFNENIDGIVINLFPNPATNQLNFTLKENHNYFNLEIYDISGKRMKSKEYLNHSNEEFKYSLDISDLKSGIYFCRFLNGEENVTRKFIKQ